MRTHLKEFKINFHLAYPIIIAQLGQMTVQFADTIMVGKLGRIPLASANFANAVFGYIFLIAIGIGLAIVPLSAGADAKHDKQEGKSVLLHAIVLIFFVGIIITALGLLSYKNILPFFQQPQEVLAQALPYFEVLLYSFLPFILFTGLKNFADGLTLTKLGMHVILVGNVINIVGNYIFIYGKWGAPALGLTGAGIGTLASRIFMFLAMLVVYTKHQKLRIFLDFHTKVKMHLAGMKKIIKIGLPTATQLFLEGALFSTCGIIAGQFGAIAGSANTVISQITILGFLLMTGFGQAASIRVGREWSLENFSYVRTIAHSNIFIVASFMLTYSLITVLLRHKLPYIFIQDAEVVAVASKLLILVVFFQMNDGIQMVLLGVLRGMHDTFVPTIYLFICYGLVGIPLSYVLAHNLQLGVYGVWLGLVIVFLMLPITLFLRLRYKLRHH